MAYLHNTEERPPQLTGVADESGTELTNVLTALRRRAWLIVLAVVCAAGVAGVLSLKTQKQYTAAATLVLGQSDLQQQLFGAVPAPADAPTLAQTNESLASSPAFQQLVARRIGLAPGDVGSKVVVSEV